MEEIKDLFNENYKSLKKKLKQTAEDGKVSHAQRLVKSIF
jgi:hypothetical protein